MSSVVALRPAPRLAPEPLPRPQLTLVRAPEPAAQQPLDLDFAPPGALPPAPAGELPAPGPVAHGVVVAILEVLEGRRSPLALRRVTTREILSAVTRRAASRRGLAASHQQPSLRRLRVAAPSPTTCEVAAVVVLGGRVRALALRLRLTGGRWVVDALDLG